MSLSNIETIIKELKNSKSTTHSKTPMHFIKRVNEEISKPLTKIFDLIVELKKWTIAPLHKKGPKYLMENYRPIALNKP